MIISCFLAAHELKEMKDTPNHESKGETNQSTVGMYANDSLLFEGRMYV